MTPLEHEGIEPMTLHCMVDLETWGTDRNTVVISIGAVKFDPYGDIGEYVDEFHVGVDPASYAGPLLTGPYAFAIDPGTVKWWMEEGRRAALIEWMKLEKVDVATALQGFAMWYTGEAEPSNESSMQPVYPHKPEAVWSNGATFDIPILNQHFKLLGAAGVSPWNFRQENCYRTIYNLLGKSTTNPPTQGVTHDALSDAKWQADKLRIMLHNLGLFADGSL